VTVSGEHAQVSSVVRPREEARAVTPLELFFDLVYVFTVSQLAHNLFEHVDARGMVETVVLTLAVMYAWFMTVWTSNWLDGDRRPVQLLLLGLMFASLLMSTSVSEAFGDRAGLFVIGYLSIQVGRTAFAVWAFRGHRLHMHFVNALAWEIGTAPIWIAGIAVDGDARLVLWAAATLITYAGVIAGHPLPSRKSPFSSDSQIYAEHLLERFRLFFLIALGETVLTIGNAFADQPLQADRLLVLAIAFAGTVALWWCYFHRAEDIGLKAVEGATDASRIVGLGNYTLILMVIGIVAIAVGDELAIVNPHDPNTLSSAVLIFGGPAIFLLAQLGYMRRVTGSVPRSRLVACLALVALAIATGSLGLLAAVTASSAVLLSVAVTDTRAGASLLVD
jgi:low temperature requirement protein LtrA